MGHAYVFNKILEETRQFGQQSSFKYLSVQLPTITRKHAYLQWCWRGAIDHHRKEYDSFCIIIKWNVLSGIILSTIRYSNSPSWNFKNKHLLNMLNMVTKWYMFKTLLTYYWSSERYLIVKTTLAEMMVSWVSFCCPLSCRDFPSHTI